MSKLIILRGNSGSGKTTAAGELQKRLGAGTLLISQDIVRRGMLRVRDGGDILLLGTLLEYGRDHCGTVILEGILSSRTYMPLFETAAKLYGGNIFAYYYDLPFEETLRRHMTKACRDEFGEAEMRDWWIEKDLSGIPGETVITADMDLESTVSGIIRDVNSR